jgi:hypothetical protein
MRTTDLREPEPARTRARGVRVSARFSPRRLDRRRIHVTRAQLLAGPCFCAGSAIGNLHVSPFPRVRLRALAPHRLRAAFNRLRGGRLVFLVQGDDVTLADCRGREYDWTQSQWRGRRRCATVAPVELAMPPRSSRHPTSLTRRGPLRRRPDTRPVVRSHHTWQRASHMLARRGARRRHCYDCGRRVARDALRIDTYWVCGYCAELVAGPEMVGALRALSRRMSWRWRSQTADPAGRGWRRRRRRPRTA